MIFFPEFCSTSSTLHFEKSSNTTTAKIFGENEEKFPNYNYYLNDRFWKQNCSQYYIAEKKCAMQSK